MTLGKEKAATVLYVDHDRRRRSAIAADLRSIGYSLIEAGSEKEAVEALSTNHPDFIVCDDALSNGSAVALLKMVREEYWALDRTPFILLSAVSDRRQLLKLRELGADDIISKPVELDILEVTLKTCLAQVQRFQRSATSDWNRDTSMRLGQNLKDADVSISSLSGTLDGMSRGVIYLDSSGNFTGMNRTAEAIVSDGSALKIASGRLSVVEAAPARTLRESMRAATAEHPTASVVPIPREMQPPLILHICPLGIAAERGLPTVAIVIIDPSVNPPLSASVIAKIYDLTRTEARIAVALVDGNRLEQIAKEFNVSLATVSFHIQNLFRKTRTTRQSDLVALLMRSSLTVPVLQTAA